MLRGYKDAANLEIAAQLLHNYTYYNHACLTI